MLPVMGSEDESSTHPGPRTLARMRPRRETKIIPAAQKIPVTLQIILALSAVGRNSVTKVFNTGMFPAVGKINVGRHQALILLIVICLL